MLDKPRPGGLNLQVKRNNVRKPHTNLFQRSR